MSNVHVGSTLLPAVAEHESKSTTALPAVAEPAKQEPSESSTATPAKQEPSESGTASPAKHYVSQSITATPAKQEPSAGAEKSAVGPDNSVIIVAGVAVGIVVVGTLIWGFGLE